MAAIGEDSSGQEMKKTCGVGKDRRCGGREVPRGFEWHDCWVQRSRVITVTPRDQLMEVTGRVS